MRITRSQPCAPQLGNPTACIIWARHRSLYAAVFAVAPMAPDVVRNGICPCPLETPDTVAWTRALDGAQSTARNTAEAISQSATAAAALGLVKLSKNLAGRWRR